jgi:putative ABC transport system permease protein
MMEERRTVNRRMFWRVIRRMVFANRGRLLVILLALGAGAAVTAALLNLQLDAKRRITSEFRSFGANVLIVPGPEAEAADSRVQGTFDAAVYDRIPRHNGRDLVEKAALLYGVAQASVESPPGTPSAKSGEPVVIVGYRYYGSDLSDLFGDAKVLAATNSTPEDDREASKLSDNEKRQMVMTEGPVVSPGFVGMTGCLAGEKLAVRLKTGAGQWLHLKANSSEAYCRIRSVRRTGGPEDSQLFLGLDVAMRLLEKEGRLSTVALRVPGNASSVTGFVHDLEASFTALRITPVRQFTENEAKLYGKISGVLTATVFLVLILTALCVMAAMTNIAAERKNDVGLMKAIGGSVRRVLRIFLAEAALLGLAAGLIGAATGMALSIGLGKAVFGVAAEPRLVVYPVSVALTVVVAILAAYPLRRLVNIRPASVFRGEQ